MRQGELAFPRWGGVRAGAGRPKTTEETVPHSTRPRHAARHPVHVTIRLRKGLPRLRRRGEYRVLEGAFRAARERFGMRVVHYSVLSNHVHLIVEARDRRAISRGMQGLAIRIAKRLNRFWDRTGRVFAERYHERFLRTPREVRNALAYVLHNARKHGLAVSAEAPDPYSSGRWFEGWRGGWLFSLEGAGSFSAPVAAARTWLLRVGWRRRGLVALDERPGP